MSGFAERHKYACVVLNYNNAAECLEYVDNISKMGIYDLIVVVDNNSPDNSYERLKEFKYRLGITAEEYLK